MASSPANTTAAPQPIQAISRSASLAANADSALTSVTAQPLIRKEFPARRVITPWMNVRYSAFGGGGSVATGGVSPTRGSGASSLSGFGERRDHARRRVGERVHEDVHRAL